MIRILSMSLVVALIAASSSRAQAPKVNPARVAPVELKAMYEDIEILRRILVKELGAKPADSMFGAAASQEAVRRGLEWLSRNQINQPDFDHGGAVSAYLSLQRASNSDNFWSAARPTPAAIDGAYLKGHGVTYSLAINPLERAVFDASAKGIGLMSICIKCHLADSVEKFLDPGIPNRVPPKISDWEKTRREVKGEKAEPQPSIASTFQMQSICAPGNLTEKILGVLAENGHHFQQLPGSENISVVITFGIPKTSATDASRKAALPAAFRSAEEQAGLGDLHAKQQKHAEAAASYAEAIKHLENSPLEFSNDTSYERVQQTIDDARKLLRGCHIKRAQALLSLGKTAEAREALGKAESANVKVNVDKSTPAPKVSPNIPAKLLITVSKNALDLHHAGMLSLEQFRRDADVQSINLPEPEKKSR